MYMRPIIGGLTALIVFAAMSLPILIAAIVYYKKKRLEHQQILAAIEKGTPLSDLRPIKKRGPAWIRNFTKGIAFIIIGGALLVLGESGALLVIGEPPKRSGDDIVVPIVLLGIGVAFSVCGLLQKKYAPNIEGNGNGGGNNNLSSPAAAENQ